MGGAPGSLALVMLTVALAAGLGFIRVRARRGLIAPRLAAGATAAVLALGLTIAAPHLVHHPLDADQGASCPALQIVGGAEATSGTSELVVVHAVVEAAELPLATSPAGAPLAAAPVRAPPV